MEVESAMTLWEESMDSNQFDAHIQALGNDITRRGVVGLLLGALGCTILATEDAGAKKKKRKKRKKKPNRCVTLGNITITCPKGAICCSPVKSTGAGCAPAGFPVCCESDGYAHEADIVCCASFSEGVEGVCIDGHANCCPASAGGGCCVDGYPVCCDNALGQYCCPLGTTCCESDPSGCCEDALRARGVTAPSAERGERKQRLGESGSLTKAIYMARYPS